MATKYVCVKGSGTLDMKYGGGVTIPIVQTEKWRPSIVIDCLSSQLVSGKAGYFIRAQGNDHALPSQKRVPTAIRELVLLRHIPKDVADGSQVSGQRRDTE